MSVPEKPIFIIGSGAVGGGLAVFLSRAGKDVTLIRSSTSDFKAGYHRIGVQLINGQILEESIFMLPLATITCLNGIIVLSNKSFANPELARLLKNKTGDFPLVLLQNGLGVEKPFLTEDYPNVLRGVLFITSEKVDDGLIRFKPVTTSLIGTVKGDESLSQPVAKLLDTAWFPFKKENDLQPVIWKKAIVNCVFNSLCPLLETDNGIFYREEAARSIANRVIEECVRVAAAYQVTLEPEDVANTLLQISERSQGQTISTLQDIRRGLPTEIDSLNSAIVRLAGQLKNPISVAETRLLGELVQLKSALNSTPVKQSGLNITRKHNSL